MQCRQKHPHPQFFLFPNCFSPSRGDLVPASTETLCTSTTIFFVCAFIRMADIVSRSVGGACIKNYHFFPPKNVEPRKPSSAKKKAYLFTEAEKNKINFGGCFLFRRWVFRLQRRLCTFTQSLFFLWLMIGGRMGGSFAHFFYIFCARKKVVFQRRKLQGPILLFATFQICLLFSFLFLYTTIMLILVTVLHFPQLAPAAKRFSFYCPESQ